MARAAAQVAVGSFFGPGLFEEMLFRAALLPHPAVDGSLAPWRTWAARQALLPLLAFVAYHLVNPRPQSRAAFSDPAFLAMVSVLGAACTAAYRLSGGSLMAAAVVHWLPVTAWLLGLGGLEKLQRSVD